MASHEHTGESLKRKIEEAESIARDAQRAEADYAELGVDSGRFPARVGPLCQWCDFRAHCPAGQAAGPEKSGLGGARGGPRRPGGRGCGRQARAGHPRRRGGALTVAALTTERLRLRPWREEDLAPFAALNADPEVMRYFPGLLGREESDAMAARLSAGIERDGWGLWALERRDSGDFIGFTGLAVPRASTSRSSPLSRSAGGWRGRRGERLRH